MGGRAKLLEGLDELGPAGHLEAAPAPGGTIRFSLRGIALAPGDRVEILLGVEEWHLGEVSIVDGRVPCITVDGSTVRIRPVAFLRWPPSRVN